MKKIIYIIAIFLTCVLNLNARTFVLSVGISNYNNEKINLHQTTKDAKSFREVMLQRSRDISVLTSSYANHDNILKTLRKIANYSQEDDCIIFFYSGHGSEGSLVTYDNYLSYTEILSVLNTAKAKTKICYIDACFSGSVAKVILSDDGKIKYPDICFMVSCRPEETSIENSLAGAGFFTKALLQGLRGMSDVDHNGKITLEELFKYVALDVAKRSKEKQHPQLYADQSKWQYVVY